MDRANTGAWTSTRGNILRSRVMLVTPAEYRGFAASVNPDRHAFDVRAARVRGAR
jgi:hypothetical protein